jgi:hypothetical protein
MTDIQEIRRLPSPSRMPQGLAFDGDSLWISSRGNCVLHEVEPLSWEVLWTCPAPGIPYGVAACGRELRVVCGQDPDDTRVIRRCLPARGFDPAFGIPCPEGTGSHLGWDGSHLHLSQRHARRLLMLAPDGAVLRTLLANHGICGQVIVDGVYYLAATDGGEGSGYWLTRVDPRGATPVIEDIARIPFAARALAFDGQSFWTNHREADQVVEFRVAG